MARTAQGKVGALNKKQRQNAKKREVTKAAKAEAEAQRLAALAKHKQQLERERTIEQLSKSRSKAPSGGMNASVDDNGKLVWE
jgi:LmbE family N-acetylglucosaminyl deacetylase